MCVRVCLIVITEVCLPRYWTISKPRKVDPRIILSDFEIVGGCYHDSLLIIECTISIVLYGNQFYTPTLLARLSVRF